MSKLLDFLVENEPAFRKARIPALYSDFQPQRTLNPDGYQANISAWRRALARIVSSGLAPSPRAAAPSLVVLHCSDQLLRELETKQYGRPLALGVVVHEALAAKDLVPLPAFLASKETIYHRPWSLWSVASWAARQTGIADYLRSTALPKGDFVVVPAVEDLAKSFPLSDLHHASRFERTFSKSHFLQTFRDALPTPTPLSPADMDVLLVFLSRDKRAILYDGKTVKVPSPSDPDAERTGLTPEDASIAQLKELLAYLVHQTALLTARVDELAVAAREAVAKKNRVAALASLKAKKLAEATLAQRFETAGQLEAVAARIQQAADAVQVVRVMEGSGEVLAALNKAVGGAEGVEGVVERLRGQMEEADEVAGILAEQEGVVVVDEGEIEGELERMEREERDKVEEAERKVKEAERKVREERERKEAEETRRRLEEAGPVPVPVPVEDKETAEAEMLLSGLSLEEKKEAAEPQAAV
ncbi:hypothetical protein QBC39DRAFT_375434 [Podospora conica]|nr:hypothetical protein QBC39DRAFT_375434 [Schizothecium conicum]